MPKIRSLIGSHFVSDIRTMKISITKQMIAQMLEFRCPNCEFTTFNSKAMQVHLILCDKHRLEEKCDPFEESFEEVKETSMIEIKEEPIEDFDFQCQPITNKRNSFQCDLCERSFSKKSALKFHTDSKHKGIKYPH